MTKSKTDNNTGSLVVLAFEGRHFEFEAVGRTRAEAEAALVKGWERHREQAGPDRAAAMPQANFRDLDTAFGISERTMEPGGFYRDRELVTIAS